MSMVAVLGVCVYFLAVWSWISHWISFPGEANWYLVVIAAGLQLQRDPAALSSSCICRPCCSCFPSSICCCSPLSVPSPWNLVSLLLLPWLPSPFLVVCPLPPPRYSSGSCREYEQYQLAVAGALLIVLSPCCALAVRVAPQVVEVRVVSSELWPWEVMGEAAVQRVWVTPLQWWASSSSNVSTNLHADVVGMGCVKKWSAVGEIPPREEWTDVS